MPRVGTGPAGPSQVAALQEVPRLGTVPRGGGGEASARRGMSGKAARSVSAASAHRRASVLPLRLRRVLGRPGRVWRDRRLCRGPKLSCCALSGPAALSGPSGLSWETGDRPHGLPREVPRLGTGPRGGGGEAERELRWLAKGSTKRSASCSAHSATITALPRQRHLRQRRSGSRFLQIQKHRKSQVGMRGARAEVVTKAPLPTLGVSLTVLECLL